MKTQCTGEQLEFHALGRRSVTGRFDGGRISSDGGGVLLREVDLRLGLTARLSKCFRDFRNRASVEHDVEELLAQRVYALALGYEDLNDHEALRDDALVSVLVGKSDLTGERRVRERDRGHALASASTLNRLELGEPEEAARSRYKRKRRLGLTFDSLKRCRWMALLAGGSFDARRWTRFERGSGSARRGEPRGFCAPGLTSAL